jgi:formate dehydrogenase iron-sulfur subunit
MENRMTVGLLFDSTKCIACGACAQACKDQNHLPGPVEEQTTAYTWTTVSTVDGHNTRKLCMHCQEPTCASVCPVAALHKTPEGAVVYDADKCMGCRYCMMACPFDVPKYQWNKPVPVVGKCIMCYPKVKKGEPTACAEVCPVGATVFGDRKKLLLDAGERIRKNPEAYVNRIYGVKEAGGTNVLMLASVEFGQLGLKTNVPDEPPPMKTWQVLSKMPDFVAVWGASLYGIHWITSRRDEVANSDRSHE